MGLHESKSGLPSVPATPAAATIAARRVRQLADPRSPTCGIDRTPIEVGSNSGERRRPATLSVGDTGEEQEEDYEESRATEEEEDPRSPSQEFERTPLRMDIEKHAERAAGALATQLDLVFLGLDASGSTPGDVDGKDRVEAVTSSASASTQPVAPFGGEQEAPNITHAPHAPPPSPNEARPHSPVQASPLREAAVNVLPDLAIYCGSPLKTASPSRPLLKQRVGPRVLGVHPSTTSRSPLTIVTPRSPLCRVSLGDCNSPGKPQPSAVTNRKGGSRETMFVAARAGRKHERVSSGDDKENSAIRALDE